MNNQGTDTNCTDDNPTVGFIDVVSDQKFIEDKAVSSTNEFDARKSTSCISWVPCGANSSKGTWTNEEDALLLSLMNSGFRCWTEISKSMAGRNPKQCRERWTEYIDPTLDRGKFTKEEDEIILKEQLKIGHRWTTIAQMLPTKRTSTDVKVRFNSLLRKHRKSVSLAQHRESAFVSAGAETSRTYPPDFLNFPDKMEGQPPLPQQQQQRFLHKIPAPPGTSPCMFLPFHIIAPQLAAATPGKSMHQQPPPSHSSSLPSQTSLHQRSAAELHFLPFAPPPRSIINQPTSYYYPPPNNPTHSTSNVTAPTFEFFQNYPQPYAYHYMPQSYRQPLCPDRQRLYDYPQRIGDTQEALTYYPSSEIMPSPVFYQNLAPNTISTSTSYEHPLAWYPIPVPVPISRGMSSSSSSNVGSQSIIRNKHKNELDVNSSSSNFSEAPSDVANRSYGYTHMGAVQDGGGGGGKRMKKDGCVNDTFNAD